MIAKAEKGQAWSSEGYIALVDGDFAGVVSFSHDSYVGVFHGADFNENGQIDFVWEGSPQELFRIAKLDTDLMFPDRPRSKDDCDYDLITQLYKEILKWAKKRGKI